MSLKTLRRIAAVGMFGLAANAQAAVLQITFENAGQSDDFVLTPLWVGLHNGSFDLWGDNSSRALELQADLAVPQWLNLAKPRLVRSISSTPRRTSF